MKGGGTIFRVIQWAIARWIVPCRVIHCATAHWIGFTEGVLSDDSLCLKP
jgi:hypothetical protein